MSSSVSSSAPPCVGASPANGHTSHTSTNQNEQSDPDLKIILLGDSAVGKSKLVERFLMNDYVPRQMSTYALTVFRHVLIGASDPLSVDFWDTAGQERFQSMHPGYYHRAHACILVFDVTRKLTYQHLQDWYTELQQYRPGLPTLIVANKIDVDYNVTKKSFGFPQKHPSCHPNVYFVSAADGTNVVKLFTTAIAAAKEYKANPHDEDFIGNVMETLDYFDKKTKTQS